MYSTCNVRSCVLGCHCIFSCRSGAVKAGSLFDFIKNLVDLPKLDKWKLEELQRLLDPNNDNRYIFFKISNTLP